MPSHHTHTSIANIHINIQIINTIPCTIIQTIKGNESDVCLSDTKTILYFCCVFWYFSLDYVLSNDKRRHCVCLFGIILRWVFSQHTHSFLGRYLIAAFSFPFPPLKLSDIVCLIAIKSSFFFCPCGQQERVARQRGKKMSLLKQGK